MDERMRSRFNFMSFAAAALVSCILAACGGGGSGSAAAPAPIPNTLSYSSPQAYLVGSPITPLSPTVTGSLSSYSVASGLPAGLSIDSDTGVISGTPSTFPYPVPSASYTVTAHSSTGTVTATIVIQIIAANPQYPGGIQTSIFGEGLLVDTFLGGDPGTSSSVSPALPPGLVFNAKTTELTGTPSEVSAPTTYTVSDTTTGQATSKLIMSVAAAPTLLDLGHSASINTLRFDGSHVLSEDDDGHWNYWDFAAATAIVRGDSGCTRYTCYYANCYSNCPPDQFAAFAGTTLVLATPVGFELRSSTDGHVLATISTSGWSWWHLASDGSYIVAGGQSGLTAWSLNGQVAFSRPGDYSKALAFAAPGEIRSVSGPAGANVVETVTVATGASATSPAFQGTFSEWFADGGSFLSVSSTTVMSWSKDAVQQSSLATTAVGTLGGQGNWFWNYANNTLSVYAVGATTAAASYSLGANYSISSSATTLGIWSAKSNQFAIVDLSSSAPSMSSQTLPFSQISGFVATSATTWLVGNAAGVLLDASALPATARYFDFGAAWSIAGSSSVLAIATASGRILLFNAGSLTPIGTIQKFSSKLQLSSDGTVLAAEGDNFDAPTGVADLDIYSLPSQSLTTHLAYDFSHPYPLDITLSGSGTVLGQVLGTAAQLTTYGADSMLGPFTRQVAATTGGPIIWSDTYEQYPTELDTILPVKLSPDGTLIAAAFGGRETGSPHDTTDIVKNGTKVATVPGWAVGWIDNNSLVVDTFYSDSPLTNLFGGTVIYDATGTRQQGTAGGVNMTSLQPLGGGLVFSYNLIEALTGASAGLVTWECDSTIKGSGSVAGAYVVFASGAKVVTMSY